MSKLNQLNSNRNNFKSGNVNSAQHQQKCIELKHGETVTYEPKMKMISNILKHVMNNLPFQLNSVVMKILPDVNAYPKSQCISISPSSLQTNVLHIVGHQLNDKTSKHLIVTSNPVPTQLLSESQSCHQLCSVLTKLKQECECVDKQSKVAAFDSLHNHIRFGMKANLQMYTLNNVKGVKFVTTINDNVGFETMQLFSGQINENSDILKLLLTPPHLNMIEQPRSSMSTQYILANKLNKNTIVTIKMNNNENRATHKLMSQRIEMIAEPLMSQDKMQQKLTQSCFIGDLPLNVGEHSYVDACSLELEKAFDYALKFRNIGAKSTHVSVSTNTRTQFASTTLRDTKIVEIDGNSMNSLHSHHSHGHHSHHHLHHHAHHHAFVFMVIALGIFAFGGACAIIFMLLKDMVTNTNNADNDYTRKQLQNDEYCSEIEIPEEENQDTLIYCPPTLSTTNNNAGEEMNNSDDHSTTEIDITTPLPESNQEILIR